METPGPDEDGRLASPGIPEGPERAGNEAADRAASFSRRALLEAGWTVPAILSVALPETVQAQSPRPPTGPGIHVDGHVDLQIGLHSDAPHTDGGAHHDVPHADSPHGDVHTDRIPNPGHVDLPHFDGFADLVFADGGFADHADGSSSHHADVAHIDLHTDLHVDVPTVPSHVDLHADHPHRDAVVNVHTDHSDGIKDPGGGGNFTDHTDGPCRTTHGDASHGDANTHADHWDISSNPPSHNDHCDTPTGHADSGKGHSDAHADAHADIRHFDVHVDRGGIPQRPRQAPGARTPAPRRKP